MNLYMNIEDMQHEVFAWADSKGWNDPGPSLDEAVALLHSEISEALEEFRVHGLKRYVSDDATFPYNEIVYLDLYEDYKDKKPLGVPSEFADILIRLLHYTKKWDIDLYYDNCWIPNELTFGGIVSFLHVKTSILLEDWFFNIEQYPNHAKDFPPHQYWSTLYSALLQFSDQLNINLFTEYEYKMAYNQKRPYRHGNKAL